MVLKACVRCGNEFDAIGRAASCETCRPIVQRAKKAEQSRRETAKHPEAKQQRQARYREKHRELLREVSAKRRSSEEHRRYMRAKRDEYRFGGLREAVLQRDGHRCQKCGATGEGRRRYIVIHHRDGDDTHNTMENLLTLCRICHPTYHTR